MKALRREFNSPSREKMIQSYYATATPIDAGRDRLSVRLNGIPATPHKPNYVTVVASDPTPWVIDPDYQQDFLSESHTWTVTR